MTRFWWVRHGPTHAKTMVGWSDLPADLSDKAALSRLDDQLPQDALVVSSTLIRAVATADALQGNRRRLPHDLGLRELHFGEWELRSHNDVAVESPALIRDFWDNPGSIRPPGGESWDDLTARVWAATDQLTNAHAGRNIVVVAHFGAILCALQRAGTLTAAQAFSHRIDPLSVTEMWFGSDGWQLGRINHLA